MHAAVSRSQERPSASADRAISAARAAGRAPPNAPWAALAPRASLVEMQQKMRPPTSLTAVQRMIHGSARAHGASAVPTARPVEARAEARTDVAAPSKSAAGAVVQRTIWKWKDGRWGDERGRVGEPDIEPGVYEGDTYNDIQEDYKYNGDPPDGGPRGRIVKARSVREHARAITEKRASAAAKLDRLRTLKALYAALAENGYTYADVPERFITRTEEYTQFKGMRKSYVKGTAILACRLAMRHMEESGRDLSMTADGRRLFADAAARRKVTEKTEDYVGGLHWMSGPSLDSDFSKWLFNDAPEPRRRGGTMNCWESVLFGAYKAGCITKATIHGAYRQVSDYQQDPANSVGDSRWARYIEAILVTGPRYEYDPDNPSSPRPLRGDIIYINSMDRHVTLALGNTTGSPEMLSLWNSPNNTYQLQRITVAHLVTSPRKISRSKVYFHRPAW